MIHGEIKKNILWKRRQLLEWTFLFKKKSKILFLFKKKTFFSPKIPNFTLIVRGTLVIVEGILILIICFGTQMCRISKEKFDFDQLWPSYASWRYPCTAGGASLRGHYELLFIILNFVLKGLKQPDNNILRL